ncbi:hypothetical protein PHMEG_00035064 [Phytophthora megakarya]|uniref:Uncharacterized protein n=1 Tax=Phytophthora megakarya TaxID=4795 RepID=A0A225UPK4_9STRA|nr:hypothetical protein PHMEG_00035064 [Phytophthora megakarya]
MGPRRTQTRQQYKHFMTKIDGIDPVKLLLLLRQHAQYLDGERDDDVDLPDTTQATATPARTPAPVRRPPTGNTASYLAAATALEAARAAKELKGKEKQRKRRSSRCKGRTGKTRYSQEENVQETDRGHRACEKKGRRRRMRWHVQNPR